MRLVARRRPSVGAIGVALDAQPRLLGLMRGKRPACGPVLVRRLCRRRARRSRNAVRRCRRNRSRRRPATPRRRSRIRGTRRRSLRSAATDRGASPGRERCAGVRLPIKPHHVDLMRHLIEQDAAALRGIEFFRPPRAIEKIRVIPRRDHAERAEFAARHDLPHRAHRRIEGVGMANDQMHVGALDCRDDGVAVGKRKRHRLFKNDVLAGLCQRHGVRARGTDAASRHRRPRCADRRTTRRAAAYDGVLKSRANALRVS